MSRPRRRQGENRARLIEAGILEFGAKGYHGTSTTAIAALAEVPQPHVYANFRAKQELFLACAERAIEVLLSSSSQSAPSAAEKGPETLLLYQLVAVRGDETLGEQADRLLSGFRSQAGEEHFERMLLRGARALLDARP